MDKWMSKLESALMPVASKVSSNRLLKVVSSSFNLILPIIIIGAIFSLLNTMNIGGYQAFLASSGLNVFLALPGKFTTDLIALYIAFTSAYSYVKNEGMEGDAIPAGLISILGLLILTPLASVTTEAGAVSYISFDFLGSKGLFSALLIGLLTGYIYTLFIKKNFTIKMPDGVPPTISKSFAALVPGTVLTFVYIAISAVFSSLTGQSFTPWFYSILETPLASMSGSLLTFCVLLFFANILWFFGLHGGAVTIPFMIMLFFGAGIENQAAFGASQPMPNILTVGFLFFLMLGGIGNTIGLAIDMLFFSKSERYKVLSKIAILPSLFSINEPIVFGLPLILNPIMAIPFFVVPQIIAVLTYFVMKMGIVGLARVAMGATGTPLIFDAWLIVGVSGVIWQILMIILSALLYLPFFKVQDTIAYKEENAK